MASERDRRASYALVAALTIAVFAVGGASRLAVCAVAVAAAVGLALLLRSRRHLGAPSPLLVLLALALGMTLLQLVPLPAAVLAWLNPTGHDLVVEGAALLGRPAPAFLPLSLDPSATVFEAAKLAAYLAIAYVALRVAVSEPGRVRLLGAVALVAMGAALVAAANRLVGAETLYGLYEARHARPTVLAPLLNPNHFACLLAIGTLAAAGLATRPRLDATRRAAWILVGAISLSVGLLTRSRGAAVALAVGGLVFALALLAHHRRSRAGRHESASTPAWRRGPIAVILMCGLTLVVYLSAAGVGAQLADLDASEVDAPRSKFAAWRSSAALIEETPWVGVGRGAFESVFTRVHAPSGESIYSHLENEYLQAAVDWGLPAAALLALALAWCAMVAVGRVRGGALPAAAAGALTVAAVQSFVDFGAELPGIAVPLILIAATLTYVPLREVAPAGRRRLVALRGAGLAGLLASAALVATPLGRTLDVDHAHLLGLPRPALEAATEAMARHPFDYLAAGHAADAAMRAGDPKSVAYLNRALGLHPTHPGLHVLTARVLSRSGRPAQAQVEYATAIAHTPNPIALVAEVLRAFPKPADAALALPPDVDDPSRIVRILIDAGRQDVLAPYFARALDVGEREPLTLELIASHAERMGALELAERAGRSWSAAAPGLPATTLLARVQLARGDLAGAEATLLTRVPGPGASGREDVMLMLTEIAVRGRRWTTARERLARLEEVGGLRAAVRRRLHELLAQIEDAEGNHAQAELERKEASGR